jgi:hypothetical protein
MANTADSNQSFGRVPRKSKSLFSRIVGKTKKTLIVFGIVWLSCLIMLPIPNYAEEIGSAVTTAALQLDTAIAVQAQLPTINKTHSGSGPIDITANFNVEANINLVQMFVETTPFYLNGVTSNPEVVPIPLHESSGVEILPNGASLVQGQNPAGYFGDGDPIDGYPSRKTDTLSFQSSDTMFSDSVAVTVTWDQDDPVKPAGQYFAKIKLTCLVEPPE